MVLVECKGLKLDKNAGIPQLKARICIMWLEQYVCVFIYVVGTEGKLFNPRGKDYFLQKVVQLTSLGSSIQAEQLTMFEGSDKVDNVHRNEVIK